MLSQSARRARKHFEIESIAEIFVAVQSMVETKFAGASMNLLFESTLGSSKYRYCAD